VWKRGKDFKEDMGTRRLLQGRTQAQLEKVSTYNRRTLQKSTKVKKWKKM